jgi:hypothetical protein
MEYVERAEHFQGGEDEPHDITAIEASLSGVAVSCYKSTRPKSRSLATQKFAKPPCWYYKDGVASNVMMFILRE